MDTDTFVLTILKPTVDFLEESVRDIESVSAKPTAIKELSCPRYRYGNPGVEHFCLCRAVRVVSALDAQAVLWRSGHVQEMGVLCRTVFEFLNDVLFMLEGYPAQSLLPNQSKMLEDWAEEPFVDPLIPFKGGPKRKSVTREKVSASVARLIDTVNASDQQQMTDVLASVYSGYVHGKYAHVMEMYGGSPPRFRMRGMRGTPREREWQKMLVFQLSHTANTLAFMAEKLRLPDRAVALVTMRQSMEKAAGLVFPLPPKDMLKRVKKGRDGKNTP